VFSLAGAIAAESNDERVRTVAFSTASLVALSRMRDNAHWTSDVAAGTVIGIGVSEYVVRRLHHCGDDQ
jgi:membrane-associated phospholipid phosphatase